MKKDFVLFFALTVLFIFSVILSFCVGKYPIAPKDLITILLSYFSQSDQGELHQAAVILLHVRIPRLLAAVLVGAALSTAGLCFQGIFQNPMVSPDVLGASSGAAFGAAFGILLGWTYGETTAFSFFLGLLSIFLVMNCSRLMSSNPLLGLVLCGIMISSLFSSATSFVKLAADPNDTLPAITYWLMGSLASVTKRDVIFAFIPVTIGLIPIILLRWRLNLLTLGEEEARSLGINTKRLRAVIIVCATLLTAASVSVSGMIGWIGLVIPHFVRMLAGCDYRRLVFASVLLGASYLLLVDTAARTMTSSEIPLGILTAFFGAPFFIYLMIRENSSHAS